MFSLVLATTSGETEENDGDDNCEAGDSSYNSANDCAGIAVMSRRGRRRW
jgi:hypothetical protein